MSKNHLAHSATHTVSEKLPELCKGLPPLSEDKNPRIAAILGVLFGPFGIGFYFKSGADFAICLAILIFLSLTGVLAPVGWIIAGAYGYHRAKESNKKRWEMHNAPPVITVDSLPASQTPAVRKQFIHNVPPPLPTATPPPLPQETKIYLSLHGQIQGPFTDAQVFQKLNSGFITSETLHWQEGMATWKPVGETLNKNI